MKFINEFKLTADMIPEMVKANYKHKKVTPAYVVMFGFLFIGCIALLLRDLFTGNLSTADIIYIVFPFITLWLAKTKVENDIQKEQKNLISMGEGQKPVTNNISGSGIEIVNHTSQKTTFYPYKKITKVIVTENLYILSTSDQMVIPLKKGAFIKGNDEGFLDFISSKCKVAGV